MVVSGFIIVHLVAVRAAYLAPLRFLPLEESSNTFQALCSHFISWIETKEPFDSKPARPLVFMGGRRNVQKKKKK